jgi:hypothetical protein
MAASKNGRVKPAIFFAQEERDIAHPPNWHYNKYAAQ